MSLFTPELRRDGLAGFIDKTMLALGRIKAITFIGACSLVIVLAIIAIVVLLMGSSHSTEGFSYQQLHNSRVSILRRGLVLNGKDKDVKA